MDICKKTVHDGRESRVNEHTNSTVRSRRFTVTDTIFSECLNRAHFDGFVASESRGITAGKIENLLTRLDELLSGTICTKDYGH